MLFLKLPFWGFGNFLENSFSGLFRIFRTFSFIYERTVKFCIFWHLIDLFQREKITLPVEGNIYFVFRDEDMKSTLHRLRTKKMLKVFIVESIPHPKMHEQSVAIKHCALLQYTVHLSETNISGPKHVTRQLQTARGTTDYSSNAKHIDAGRYEESFAKISKLSFV